MPKVLIVDDSDENLCYLRDLLAERGYQVTDAKNGAEALAKARSTLPDLIIADILMPVMDGFELCRALRNDPQLADIPFVFYTGTYTDSRDEDLAINLGADSFLIKPMEVGPFLEALQDVLQKHAARKFVRRHLQPDQAPTLLQDYNAALIRKLEDKVSELNASEQRLRSYLDAACQGIVGVGGDGRICLVNRTLEQMFGFNCSELIGQPLEMLLPRDLCGAHVLHREAFFSTPRVRVMGAGLQLAGRRKDGTEFPIDVGLSFVQNNGKLLAIGLVSDISERKQAEAALRVREEQLSLFVEHAPAALAMFDREMRYLRVSRRWNADYGLGDRDLTGVSHYDVFPEIGEHWKDAHHRGLKGEVVRGEDALKRLDGRVQWIRWEIRPWHDRLGEIGGIVIFSEDTTERKRAEESLRIQADQLRALTARLQKVREEERARVARDLHDQIGQILTAVKMDVDWVAKRIPQDNDRICSRLAATVDLIRGAAKSLRTICAQLRPGVLDDLGLAAAIEWQAREFASRTGLKCDVSVPTEDFVLTPDDSTAIFRIFQEALTNIARHANASMVRASLVVRDDHALLTVQDDGRGITDSDLRASKGSLGLLGMKERAQARGGDFQIWGDPGKGTTLAVSIPFGKAELPGENHAHLVSR